MTPRIEAKRAMALTLFHDVIMAFVAMYFAVEARWRIFSEFADRPFDSRVTIFASVIFAMSAALAIVLLRVHRQVWRHSGWPDAVRVAQAAGLAALIFLPIMFLWNRLEGFPRSSLLIALPVWLGLLFLGRMIALNRSTRRPLQIFSQRRQNAPRALLVGDHDALADALRDLERDPKGSPIRVLGLIETGGAVPGLAIRGVTVHGGLGQLASRLDMLAERYGAYPWVATVGEGRSRWVMKQVLEATSERGSAVMALGGETEGAPLVPVRPADLLGRQERDWDEKPIESLVQGSRVFVTGGGGTIGSELVRQCARHNPAKITIYDSSEYNLYKINMLLSRQFPDIAVEAVLGDVRESARLARIMRDAQPDIVFHAAALKHVPLMELNPCEAILTNAGGAANTARAAVACNVKKFVFISTDKAVDPDNVMGATKRLAEMVVRQITEGTDMAVSMVRFGNVLGSSGSVVPLFDKQIAAGGPVTVTHKDMTRFFMTVEEAVYLVLQASTQQTKVGEAGLYVLDMGDPVRIQSLAEAMIRMKGYVPGVDILIEHTGPRPGDKMHERLTYDHEDLAETDIDGVRVVQGEQPVPRGFELAFESLLKTATNHDPKDSLAQLSGLVQNYSVPRHMIKAAGTG
ncbi:MAG: nucleoside-diphosphate sugar epimerase/dehydratase [Pseudomonadota bacterium]